MDVHVLVEKQRQEIDMLLRVQNEKFISVLQRLSSQHISSVLKKKNEEITKANTKMIELQNHVWKLETGNQLWQRTARDAEAAVVALKSALERVRKESNEASSECCSSSNPRTPEKIVLSCRTCRSRDSCMLILPCRHLCSCKTCDWMNQLCPVCNSVKNGSVEVLFQ
ncbi:hypothetical protein QJS10_CPB11g02013 [Acorus calamus]|uniref:RING-type domain-containing protein n=1 Tax=Acorus calamus TaxID=4465 RepID=A0AAV9DUT4_ACOCL|nr:hypothetical protein QJS10_CPB11g02013 [Acorus calamus]